jgi:hypothetical protein
MKHLTIYLSTALLLAGSIQASAHSEHAVAQESERLLPAGVRTLPKSEQVAMQENRVLEEEQAQEIQACDKGKKKDKNTRELIEQAIQDNNGAQANVSFVPHDRAALYFTTHPGAFHQPMLVSMFGDSCELEDGSVWSISANDSYKTLNWLVSDVILIMPNHAWFSNYNYKLVNQNTGIAVEANLTLFLNPVFHSAYNHRIIAIDDIHQRIWLEDGSVWSISFVDYSTKWQINDTVIIGINDSWSANIHPNILINADLLHHVRARCTN